MCHLGASIGRNGISCVQVCFLKLETNKIVVFVLLYCICKLRMSRFKATYGPGPLPGAWPPWNWPYVGLFMFYIFILVSVCCNLQRYIYLLCFMDAPIGSYVGNNLCSILNLASYLYEQNKDQNTHYINFVSVLKQR